MVEIPNTPEFNQLRRALISWTDFPKRVYAYAKGHYKYLEVAIKMKTATVFISHLPSKVQKEIENYKGKEHLIIICLQEDEAAFKETVKLRPDLSIQLLTF